MSPEYIQVRVPLWIFFTINKQAHYVQNNPGYDAMQSWNCTSNIVSMIIDTVYDMSLEMWSAHLESQVFGLLLWHQSSIYYNPQRLIFQNTQSHLHLQHFPKSDNKTFTKVALLTRIDFGNFLSHDAQVHDAQVQYSFQLKLIQHCEPENLHSTSCIACYCTATAFQCRCLLVPKICHFQPVYGYEFKGLSACIQMSISLATKQNVLFFCLSHSWHNS